MAGNMQGCIFKVGDNVLNAITKERHKVTSVEYYETHECWYIGIDDDEEPERGVNEFILSETLSLDKMSVEELASLVVEAEKLLGKKQEEMQAEIKVGNVVRRKEKYINRYSHFPALYGAEMVVTCIHEHNGEQKLIFNDGFVHGWQAYAYELVAEHLVEEKTIEDWLDYYTNSKGNIVAAELLEDILDNPEKIANMLLRYAEQMEN